MKDTSKREQLDSLKTGGIVPSVNGEISVVEDLDSRARGPERVRAAITKALFDTYNDMLKRLGLSLSNACLGWQTDQSPEQVYDRLRGMRLISDQRSLPNLFSA